MSVGEGFRHPSMNVLLHIILAWACLGSAWQIPFFHSGEQSLVQLADGAQRWVSESEKWELKRRGIHFADITGTEDLGTLRTNVRRSYSYPKIRFENQIKPLLTELDKGEMSQNLEQFTSFKTRYYKSEEGKKSSDWLLKKILSISSADEAIEVRAFHHQWPQSSIIARIPGSTNSTAIAIIGAHQDSANFILPNIFPAPGADDDGSGTVTILEAFRVLVGNRFRPNNTVEFHWYSAEEGGLLGSRAIYKEYEKQGVDCVAMLQQDMTGYVKKTLAKNQPEAMGVVQDYVSPELTSYVETIIETYCAIPSVSTKCGYACSDHASAQAAGYPASFVIESAFENSNPKIHSTGDVIDELSFDHMREHAKLTLAFAYELGFYS